MLILRLKAIKLNQTVDAKEKNNSVLWAENFGEAVALKNLGKK
jgi:hypothetical protein